MVGELVFFCYYGEYFLVVCIFVLFDEVDCTSNEENDNCSYKKCGAGHIFFFVNNDVFWNFYVCFFFDGLIIIVIGCCFYAFYFCADKAKKDEDGEEEDEYCYDFEEDLLLWLVHYCFVDELK